MTVAQKSMIKYYFQYVWHGRERNYRVGGDAEAGQVDLSNDEHHQRAPSAFESIWACACNLPDNGQRRGWEGDPGRVHQNLSGWTQDSEPSDTTRNVRNVQIILNHNNIFVQVLQYSVDHNHQSLSPSELSTSSHFSAIYYYFIYFFSLIYLCIVNLRYKI